jgi:hypothetical protein
VSRDGKLYRRLVQGDAELREIAIPLLRAVAAGRGTGLFVVYRGRPSAEAAPMVNQAQEILKLATQLGEPPGNLVAYLILRAFEHANDTSGQHRLGPIRLARSLLEQLEA